MANLASQGLVPQTVKAAIHYFHITAGHGGPFAPGALPHLQVRGIKRAPNTPLRPQLPLTPPLLQAIKTCWESRAAEHDTVMIWAACCMGFFGFMRAEEFTVQSGRDTDQESCLTVSVMAVDSHNNPTMVRLHLKQSKTDPGQCLPGAHRCYPMPSFSYLSLLCSTSPHCKPFLRLQ